MLNNSENALFIGTNEGTVKIFDLDCNEIVGEMRPFKNDPTSTHKNFDRFYKNEFLLEKRPGYITCIAEVGKGILVSNSDGAINMACPSIF